MKQAYKNKSEKKESVCMKSMELVFNIIKLSSFTLATINLGNKISKSKRSNSSVRVIGDDHDHHFSDYIQSFHTRNKSEAITDGKAAAFINKFHQKNSRNYTPPLLPLPPPPPPPPPPPLLNKSF